MKKDSNSLTILCLILILIILFLVGYIIGMKTNNKEEKPNKPEPEIIDAKEVDFDLKKAELLLEEFGLHFTDELIKKLEEKGVKIANVTLHVGIGTFRPVKEENIEDHKMHTEHFYIKQEDVEKINETKKAGKRVIAVGTTSCRVLESIADESEQERKEAGQKLIKYAVSLKNEEEKT